jgi:hypothetical protein
LVPSKENSLPSPPSDGKLVAVVSVSIPFDFQLSLEDFEDLEDEKGLSLVMLDEIDLSCSFPLPIATPCAL